MDTNQRALLDAFNRVAEAYTRLYEHRGLEAIDQIPKDKRDLVLATLHDATAKIEFAITLLDQL
jgi:hypothetical protein